MLSVEDWAEIRRLRRAEQMPIAHIGRVLGISRNTVKAALASDGPPKYRRAPAGSVVDGFGPRIPGAASGVSADAVDGDRGADRLAVFDPHLEREGGGAAAVVSAAGFRAGRTVYLAWGDRPA